MIRIKNFNTCLDYIGIATSGLCALHCIIFPVLYVLPVIALGIQPNEELELMFLIISGIVGLLSLSLSYYRNHKKYKPAFFFFSGFSLVLLGHLVEVFIPETLLSLAGAALIIYSHLINQTLCRMAKRGSATC